MPLANLDQDLQQKVLMAIQAGAPQAEAISRAEQIQASRQPPAQQSGLLRTLATPFERAGRSAGGALFEMARAGANPQITGQGQTGIQKLLNPANQLAAMAAKVLGVDTRYTDEQGNTVENPFLNEQSLQKITSNPVGEAAKTTAGVLSYAVPMGKLTAPLISGAGAAQLAGMGARGALASGLFEAGLPGSTIQDVENTAKSGVLINMALPIVGRGLTAGKNLVGKALTGGVKAASNQASAAFLKATGAQVDEAITGHGVDPIQLAKKYIGAGQGYDDVLGPIADRGKGGTLGDLMTQAEGVISGVRKAAGSNFRLDGDAIISELKNQRKLLANSIGNDVKIAQLDKLIKQAEKKYVNGVTVNKALNTVRAANSKFGKAVTETTKGATVVSAQKAEANALRTALKEFFPEIDQALQTQEDIFTLRPLLNRARSQAKVARTINAPLSYSNLNRSGSTGGIIGAVVGGVPGAAIGAGAEIGAKALLNQPEIQSRLMQLGQGAAKQTPNILDQITSLAGRGAAKLPAATLPIAASQATKANATPGQTGDVQSQLDEIAAQTDQAAQGPDEATRQQLYNIRLKLGSDAKFKEYLDLYKLKTGVDLMPSGPDAKTAAFTKQLTNTVEIMQQIYNGNGNPLSLQRTAGLGGVVSRGVRNYEKAMSQEMQDRITEYRQAAALAVGILNKARGAGTLNAGEFDVMMANIPNEYTSEAAAKEWFKNARALLQNATPSTTSAQQ